MQAKVENVRLLRNVIALRSVELQSGSEVIGDVRDDLERLVGMTVGRSASRSDVGLSSSCARLRGLEHLIRAAGTIANDDLVIVGSQAVLGTFPVAPSELLRSMEADMYPRHTPGAADEIDAAIGDGSYVTRRSGSTRMESVPEPSSPQETGSSG